VPPGRRGPAAQRKPGETWFGVSQYTGRPDELRQYELAKCNMPACPFFMKVPVARYGRHTKCGKCRNIIATERQAATARAGRRTTADEADVAGLAPPEKIARQLSPGRAQARLPRDPGASEMQAVAFPALQQGATLSAGPAAPAPAGPEGSSCLPRARSSPVPPVRALRRAHLAYLVRMLHRRGLPRLSACACLRHLTPLKSTQNHSKPLKVA